MRYRHTLVFFVLLTTLAAAPAMAQIVPGWDSKQFRWERIDADRVKLVGEIEIEGTAGGAYAGQKFFADELELNHKTGELTARGNVTFRTATAQITADSVTFNTKTRLGTFENASGIAQLGERGVRDRSMFGTLEPDIYFHGESIEKIGADKYRIRNGAFTTCVQPTPRWEIVSGNATINLHDYAMLRNAVIRVKDVPVFYLPLIYYPIQEDDRATGFLLPTYGTSVARGNSISNAFFWAINRSMDATVFHDWLFARGTGMGAEYRYLLASQSQGTFQYYRLDEKEALINGRTQQPRKSTKITGGLSQGLPFNLSARARIDYFTDITVQQLYNNNFADASQSTRTFDGGISGAWRSLTMNGRYQRIEYFDVAGNSTINGQEPGFTAAFSGYKLGPLPLFASINADAGRVIYRLNDNKGKTLNDLSLMKADVVPSLRAPLSSLPFLQVNATASYRTTYFSESLAADKRTQIETPVTRRYADMRLDIVGPVFSKVFNPNNALADRLKHVIEPSYSVQRRTKIGTQDFIPKAAGGYDTIIGGTTQVSYGLANRVLVRKETPGVVETSGPRELLTVNVRQSYYTDERASQFDTSYSYGQQYRKPSPFSPISLSARAAPTVPVGIDFRMEYDPTKEAEKKILGFGLNALVRTGILESTTGWSRQAFGSSLPGRSNNYINHGMALRFMDGRFGGNTTINFDIGMRKLYNHRYVAYYSAQCCGIQFEFQSFDYSANTNILVAKDRRFNMSFTLAGVGSFSNFFGAFGGGTY
jgi:LPS-assembly protein